MGPENDHLSPSRMAAVRASELLDSPSEEAFDRITRLASRMLGAPITLVSIVDAGRQFFKSAQGLGEPWATRRETPISHSFCRHVVKDNAALVVDDARLHPILRDNPAVSELDVVAYLGVPIESSDHEAIGALCAIDSKPRAWSDDDLSILRELCALVMTEIELRGSLRALQKKDDEAERQAAIYRAIAENLPNGCVFMFDRDLRYIAADGPELLETFGMSRESVVGKRVSELSTAANRERVMRAYQDTLAGGQHESLVERSGRTLTMRTAPVRGRGGEIVAGVVLVADVTESQQHASLLRTLVHELPNGAVTVMDRELRCILADGPKLEAAVGFTKEQMEGAVLDEERSQTEDGKVARRVFDRVFAGHVEQIEWQRAGSTFEWRSVPVRDERQTIIAALSIHYDVTERKREADALRAAQELLESQAQELRMLSLVDELTGLHNRRGFLLVAQQVRKQALREKQTFSLLFVDLDGMKRINDQLGHQAGDMALRETAALLKKTFRDADVVARLGGDEFVVLAHGLGKGATAGLRARLQSNVDDINARRRLPFDLALSVGEASFEHTEAGSIESLLEAADSAMYAEKQRRKRTVTQRMA